MYGYNSFSMKQISCQYLMFNAVIYHEHMMLFNSKTSVESIEIEPRIAGSSFTLDLYIWYLTTLKNYERRQSLLTWSYVICLLLLVEDNTERVDAYDVMLRNICFKWHYFQEINFRCAKKERNVCNVDILTVIVLTQFYR